MNEQKEIVDVEVLSGGKTPETALAPVRSELMALPSYEDSLEAYLKRLAQIPLLSREDEIEYARRYRDDKDVKAGQYLILSNLRFVVYVAKGFRGYGLPLADIIQEGNMGLMKAAAKFDPDQNVRFISYAVYWIRCDINEYIIKNMRIVRSITSKDRRKLLFNLSKHMRAKEGRFTLADRQSLAEEYGVSIKDIEIVESALGNQDSSLDYRNAHGQSGVELLPDHSSSPDLSHEDESREKQHQDILTKMLASLNERQREIITQRWLSPDKPSLEALAEKYNVSMQRISQIEKQALQKCKEAGFNMDDILLAD